MGRIRLLVVGAGGHGRSVTEAAVLTGDFEVVGYLDDARCEGELMFGVRVLGPIASVRSHRYFADQAVVVIGNNRVRQNVTDQLSQQCYQMAIIIHPRSFVSPSALVGAGSTIMAGAIVGMLARLGEALIVNCGAVVDHHATVEDFGHMGGERQHGRRS